MDLTTEQIERIRNELVEEPSITCDEGCDFCDVTVQKGNRAWFSQTDPTYPNEGADMYCDKCALRHSEDREAMYESYTDYTPPSADKK